jgi:hypothetical protein
MTSSRPEPVDGDDEALSWGEELDASHVDGPSRADVRPGSDDDLDDDPDAVRPMSSAALIGHGILGGALLLCAVGWIALMGRFSYTFPTPLATGLWRFGVVVAVAAPVLWFVATLAVVPAAASRRRLVVLLIGALVVAPWPLLVGAGA